MKNVVTVSLISIIVDHIVTNNRVGLAERRERRRVKKAIVDPKLDPLTSGEDEEIERQCGARRKSKAKAGKGLKMPAGLALMHGFTAANVGKNRLTVRSTSSESHF